MNVIEQYLRATSPMQKRWEQEQAAQANAQKMAGMADQLYGSQTQENPLPPDLAGPPETIQGSGYLNEDLSPTERRNAEFNRGLLASGMPELQSQWGGNNKQLQKSNMTAQTASDRLAFDREKMQQPGAEKNVYSDIKVDDKGRAFGYNRMTQRYEQMPGDQMQKDPRGPLVSVNMNNDTLENKADLETYKILGKSRGKRLSNFSSVLQVGSEVVDSIEDTKGLLQNLAGETGMMTTGFASLANVIPHLPPKDWLEMKDIITSRLAVDKMGELKALSSTGSTGFGALSTKELEVLQKQLGSLEQAQSPDAIKRQIVQITRLLGKSADKFKKRRKEEISWYNRNKLGNMEAYADPVKAEKSIQPGNPTETDRQRYERIMKERGLTPRPER